jgi:general secretion pathway protein E
MDTANLPAEPVLLAAATAYSLVSWIKPMLVFATILPYFWVASRIEPDARRFMLPVPAINGVLVGGAALGLAAVLLIPIFWVGWPVMILVLAGTLFGYWKWRDRQVPEGERFQLVSGDLSRKMEERKAAKLRANAILKFTAADGRPVPVPLKDSPEYATLLAVETVLVPALERRASRSELAPGGANQPATPSYVLDGVRYRLEPLPPQVAEEATNWLKKIAGLDLADRRRKQVGEFRVDGPNGLVKVTLTAQGSSAGQSIRAEFDRQKRMSIPYDNLGLLPPQKAALDVLAQEPERRGVVLVSTPPGQGATTTAYSLLARHDAYLANILTLERTVELPLEGVKQSTFDASNPNVEFSNQIQAMLRRDPQVVYCCDLEDPKAAAYIAGAVNEQPLLVYVGVPADGVAGAVAAWFRAVGDLKTASKALRAVVFGRLVRKTCEACRQPVQPTPELLKKLGVPAGKTVNLFQASGKVQVKNRIEECPVCKGVGYTGQTACFEVMVLDDAMRGMLAANDFAGAYNHARREGRMLTVQEAALAKVREGMTTPEEVARVLATPKPAAKPAAPAAPKPAAG